MNTYNLDTQELHHFEQMAAQWWDLEGPCKHLHKMNAARLQFIQRAMSPLSDYNAIDIGCGGGILTESLARKGMQVTGLDPNIPVIDVARAHALQENLSIHYIAQDSTQFLSAATERFSVVTCMELLEHVPDIDALVQDCSQLAKPNGHVFFSTINRTPIAWVAAILMGEYLLNWLPRGTHRYARFVKPAELAASARKAGLTVIQCQGNRYRPLFSDWQLSSFVSVNYLMHCKKLA
jgi:2-polyprenyl-6-hydroxyphenyl methylase/3-demethylubiquinone-9 3-methyltransferase